MYYFQTECCVRCLFVQFQIVVGAIGLPTFCVRPFLFHFVEVDVFPFFNWLNELLVNGRDSEFITWGVLSYGW